MITTDPASLLEEAELIIEESAIVDAIKKLASEITEKLSDQDPLVLSVMGGAVVFTGQLLPLLRFPLHFDYVQASRYHNQTQGQDLLWRVAPGENVCGRTVLLLDDILDEGITLAAVRQQCLEMGAKAVYIAVLSEKIIPRTKPIQADFVGVQLPDRYVFGCGMDVHGRWRNLPAIYALK